MEYRCLTGGKICPKSGKIVFFLFWGQQFFLVTASCSKILFLGNVAILRGSHLELFAEKSIEVAAAAETTLLYDEAYGIVGGGNQLGGMADAPVVEEVANGLTVGTLADGGGHGVVVRGEHLGEAVAAQGFLSFVGLVHVHHPAYLGSIKHPERTFRFFHQILAHVLPLINTIGTSHIAATVTVAVGTTDGHGCHYQEHIKQILQKLISLLNFGAKLRIFSRKTISNVTYSFLFCLKMPFVRHENKVVRRENTPFNDYT